MANIDELLQRDPQLARLTGHAAILLRLQDRLAATLPEPLRPAVRVANLKDGRLLLHADNGAVATRLRQQAPTLVSALRLQGGEVTGIEVRVQPRNPPSTPPAATPAMPPGAQARQALATLADRLEPPSPLRKALQRLLARGMGRSEDDQHPFEEHQRQHEERKHQRPARQAAGEAQITPVAGKQPGGDAGPDQNGHQRSDQTQEQHQAACGSES